MCYVTGVRGGEAGVVAGLRLVCRAIPAARRTKNLSMQLLERKVLVIVCRCHSDHTNVLRSKRPAYSGVLQFQFFRDRARMRRCVYRYAVAHICKTFSEVVTFVLETRTPRRLLRGDAASLVIAGTQET